MSGMAWKPDVTVAAVVERDGKFLLVEERSGGRVVVNQPAGHLEDGETFLQAVARETLEETAWSFRPTDIVGVYVWRSGHRTRTFLRVAFAGELVEHFSSRPLDRSILRVRWLTRAELDAPGIRARSPLVKQCVDDYLAGTRYPIELISHLVTEPAAFAASGCRSARPAATVATAACRRTTGPGATGRRARGDRIGSMAAQERVLLGMSGGVDSAVAAVLLKEAGYDVHALFMRNWEEDDDGYCTAARDLQDARRVCDDLGLPLHTVNFATEYRERVFAHFLDEYRAGRTPNPDVACNREIKFGVCFEHARRLGARWFATGHYARTAVDDGRPLLLRAADAAKDQTYFLHTVPGDLLARTLFPIGHLAKQEVRRIAHERALPVHDKRDSTGICFIGERPFAHFLARYLPARPGVIETVEGREVGEHRGLMYYTLGQRQGLAIGGVKGAAEAAWYVADKDLARNVLVVTQRHDDSRLMCREFTTERAHWVNGMAPGATLRCTVKTRYRQPDQSCVVSVRPDGCCHVGTDEPQWAVTPGQSAVFYDGEACLGGAVIAGIVRPAAAVAIS
jgi:tRNA-specific 2-thiouridylase